MLPGSALLTLLAARWMPWPWVYITVANQNSAQVPRLAPAPRRAPPAAPVTTYGVSRSIQSAHRVSVSPTSPSPVKIVPPWCSTT